MGNGTYGQVYKVRNFHCIFVNHFFITLFLLLFFFFCTSWFPYACGPVRLHQFHSAWHGHHWLLLEWKSYINILLNIHFFCSMKESKSYRVRFCSPEMSWGSPDRVLNSSVRSGPCTAPEQHVATKLLHAAEPGHMLGRRRQERREGWPWDRGGSSGGREMRAGSVPELADRA